MTAPPPVVVIRSADDLRRCAAAARLFLPRVRVVLDAPIEERESLQQRMNRFLADCGCSTGAVFALIGALGATILAGISGMSLWRAAGVVVLSTVIAAGAGKCIGLAFAAFRFRRTCALALARMGC